LTNSYSNTCSVDEDSIEEEAPLPINFSILLTQALDVLRKSAGFRMANKELGKLNLAILDKVEGDSSTQTIGAKLSTNQFLLTSLLIGSLFQLEIIFEPNKSLQMWVKSSDNQYVLVGDITFDKDGSAVLPGIEFKESGQYELIFVISDILNLAQPELSNKVMGLTVSVN
jgi:ribosomal protein L27